MDDDGREIPGQCAKISERYAAELACFYSAYARWLFGWACLQAERDQDLTAARELAADLVQDTFEAAALAWETLRDLEVPQQRAWLRTTLSRKGTSDFRRRVALRRKQPELHRQYQDVQAGPEQEVLASLDAERAALAAERAAKIIEALPEKQRKIALMKWNGQMKEAEIAAEMGCAKGTVAAQVHKIRRKLLDGLGPYNPFSGNEEGGDS